MNVFEWNVTEPLNYALTGKFEAPSDHWVHEDFALNDYELFVVTKGTLYMQYREDKFFVNEGEFLILPPSPPPENRRKGYRRSDCSFYWMHFSGKGDVKLQQIPGQKQKEYPYPVMPDTLAIPQQSHIPYPEKILVLMRQLQDAVKTDFCSTTLNYMTTTILCELHSQFFMYEQKASPEGNLQKQMYFDIIDFVKLNTTENIRVSDIAKHFGYNEKYLSHQFSTISGLSLKQFILRNKMDMANFMLTDTNKSIMDISESLGFSDSHNFAKAYKKVCGLTPSEYRNAFSKRLLYHK